MDLIIIFVTAFIVGLSGAMMPGPVTAAVAEQSMRRGIIAGPMIVLGHGLLEVFVVVLLILGLAQFMAIDFVAGFLGVGGGLILLWMGYGMIKNAVSGKLSLENIGEERQPKKNSPFLAGIWTTLSNPYWFIWWATVGAGYVVFALNYGGPGLFSFFTGHILSDLFWFSLLAVVFATGKKFLTDRIYAGIISGLGVFLWGFAIYFLWSGINFLRS